MLTSQLRLSSTKKSDAITLSLGNLFFHKPWKGNKNCCSVFRNIRLYLYADDILLFISDVLKQISIQVALSSGLCQPWSRWCWQEPERCWSPRRRTAACPGSCSPSCWRSSRWWWSEPPPGLSANRGVTGTDPVWLKKTADSLSELYQDFRSTKQYHLHRG